MNKVKNKIEDTPKENENKKEEIVKDNNVIELEGDFS